ncbi:hypothetical protein ES288_D08G129700v1 [Gossypium darwinii]|uniref:Uncharacterized protein n=2 Tax=Gossypium TaxID=3633 RepID=A0A5D2JT26_GOSTO|nr:hypothetical protein ES288_D08G129700v1 [Gossypium darwinii]TYH57977.1 hypothetical protein ES332_D08G125100v1 [Gossypium tomentosum]
MLYVTPIENAGLVASGTQKQPKAKNPEKDHLQCDYCGKPRHIKETCGKLHGRPTRGRGGKRANQTRGQANLFESTMSSKEVASTETFSSDEIQHLRRLLSQFGSSSNATSANKCLFLFPIFS